MTTRMRESVERVAHAALGVPVVAVKALSARIGDLRDLVRTSSEEIGHELAREMDDWIAEGEQVIERALRRIRQSETTEEARESARTASKKAALTAEKVKDDLEPDSDLTVINGVGESYEAKMREAGINGVNAFMSATGTEEDIAALAHASGFNAPTIRAWRDQVDLSRINGIGGVYKTMLRHADVWTLSQLAGSDPAALVSVIHARVEKDSPDQMPSAYSVESWVSQARELTGSG